MGESLSDPIEVVSNLPAMRTVNYTDVDTEVVMEAARGNEQFRQFASAVEQWVGRTRAAVGRGNLFSRGTYTPPDHVYSEMQAARIAVETDDIVGGVYEITESFAFGGAKWESEEQDVTDVFNQHAKEIDLDAVLRKMWREEYTYSQFVVGMRWDWRTYKATTPLPSEEPPAPPKIDPATGQQLPPEKPKKRPKRRKEYRVWAPVEIKMLDSTKIVPVAFGPFGQERLAWIAAKDELAQYNAVRNGEMSDPLIAQFFDGPYKPNQIEEEELAALGVDTKSLLLLNPEFVQRHTITRPDYERFADVRLKSCFRWLDMKRQLLDADRAALVGAANYILLIRKGSKDLPAKQEEIDSLKENYTFLARVPVIIADHRLEIDIISPVTDFTLDQDKYDTIDTRLLARLLGTLSLGSRGQRNETNVTLSHAVARNMENRRHMLRRFLEKNVARAIVEHPRNKDLPDAEPNLVYIPRNISLGIDTAMAQLMASARDHRDISRETWLEFLDLDQKTEAQRMEMESDLYDPIFKTQIPFAAPGAGGTPPPALPAGPNGGPPSPGASGRTGGRPVGGGGAKKGAAKKTTDRKPRTPNGNKTTKKAAAK